MWAHGNDQGSVGGYLCVCVCACVCSRYVWEGELYSHADGAWWTPYTFGFSAVNKLTIFIRIYTESESCSVMSDSLRPHRRYSPWNSLGQNTGVGSRSLLQGILPTQESNPGLLHCRQILYQLSHKGSLYLYPTADKAEALWLNTNM